MRTAVFKFKLFQLIVLGLLTAACASTNYRMPSDLVQNDQTDDIAKNQKKERIKSFNYLADRRR